MSFTEVAKSEAWENSCAAAARCLEGEEETPLLKASTAITKYLSVSISLPGPKLDLACSLVPPAQVGKRIALDLSAWSLPKGAVADTTVANHLATPRFEIPEAGELLILGSSARRRNNQGKRKRRVQFD